MRSIPGRFRRTSVLKLGALLLTACSGAPELDAPRARAAAPVPHPALAEPAVFLTNVTGKPPAAQASLLPCPGRVPEALNPPESATLALALPADGVQVYVCASGKPGEAPAWSLDGPHALLGSRKEIAGTHFAGPTWQTLDGSSVKGAKLASADAPAPDAIPWLLLSATPAAEGSLARVSFIQRLDTVGGKAPASGCDASHVGARVLVPYQAKYYFYRSADTGEAVKQCRAKGSGG